MTISTGIVGAGLSAKIFHSPFITNNKDFKLAAFLRTSNKKVEGYEQIPVYSDKTEFLSLVDLVIVTSPSHLHYSQTKEFLNQGKHVVVEKPISAAYNQSIELVELAKKQNLILATFQNRIFDGDF